MADVVKVTEAMMRERAKELYEQDGQIEIDDSAELSAPEPGSVGSDKGAYVQAWVWVPLGPDEELVQPESIAVLA